MLWCVCLSRYLKKENILVLILLEPSCGYLSLLSRDVTSVLCGTMQFMRQISFLLTAVVLCAHFSAAARLQHSSTVIYVPENG